LPVDRQEGLGIVVDDIRFDSFTMDKQDVSPTQGAATDHGFSEAEVFGSAAINDEDVEYGSLSEIQELARYRDALSGGGRGPFLNDNSQHFNNPSQMLGRATMGELRDAGSPRGDRESLVLLDRNFNHFKIVNGELTTLEHQ